MNPRYTFVVEVASGPDDSAPEVRLRRAMKGLGSAHSIRCVWMREGGDVDGVDRVLARAMAAADLVRQQAEELQAGLALVLTHLDDAPEVDALAMARMAVRLGDMRGVVDDVLDALSGTGEVDDAG